MKMLTDLHFVTFLNFDIGQFCLGIDHFGLAQVLYLQIPILPEKSKLFEDAGFQRHCWDLTQDLLFTRCLDNLTN